MIRNTHRKIRKKQSALVALHTKIWSIIESLSFTGRNTLNAEIHASKYRMPNVGMNDVLIFITEILFRAWRETRDVFLIEFD